MKHNYTITPVKASGPGALDGFKVTCEDCGHIGSSSQETIARQMYGEGHKKAQEAK